MAANPKYVKTLVPLSKGKISIYASPKIAAAFKVLTELDLFSGVKMLELIEAAYNQGNKDGARKVKLQFETMMKAIPHQNPGRPKKKKK
jgi:hypothetical protein